jgi:predicted metalloprotease with PDZ domain
MTIRYDICPIDPHAHLFNVRMCFHPQGSTFSLGLPVWIPGSYMIREFARHIVQIEAHGAQGMPIVLQKTDKHTWHGELLDGVPGEVTVTYRVYAWDLSVRGSHLDASHGFFNPAALCLYVQGQTEEAIEIGLRAGGPASHGWQVATGLHRKFAWDGMCAALPLLAVGQALEYTAANYDELIDNPVEMGHFASARFEAGGAVHHIAVLGAWADLDLPRLVMDLQPICEYQVSLFDPAAGRAPFDEYWFLIHAAPEAYGGLEHRNSTALLCSPKDLPYTGMTETTGDYRGFLGLCSHEYFHAWHVKRIKPAAFIPYDLSRENYTRLLWIFEGFTSYYDDLCLIRAKAISTKDYLDLLGKSVSSVLTTPGRHTQSVADSSFDAWVKYYRQDENAANAMVSYYSKGSLVALCLDIGVRRFTQGKQSLDDVLRILWTRFGKTGLGLAEDGFAAVVREAVGWDARAVIEAYAESTSDLPLEELLEEIGHRLIAVKAETTVDAGLIVQPDNGGFLQVKRVRSGGAGHAAGLAAGDTIVAIDDFKATDAYWKTLQKRRKAQSASDVLVLRRDRLLNLTLAWQAAEPTSWRVERLKPEERSADTLAAPWETS